MRKQFLTVLLPMLVMVLIAAAAQTQSTGATGHPTLQNVNVVRMDDGMQSRLRLLIHRLVTTSASHPGGERVAPGDIPGRYPAGRLASSFGHGE